MNDMTIFLEERALFEVTQLSQKSVQSHKNASKNGIHSRSNPKQSQSCMAATISKNATIKSNNKCLLCSEEHLLYYCKQFLNMSTPERYDVVKKLPFVTIALTLIIIPETVARALVAYVKNDIIRFYILIQRHKSKMFRTLQTPRLLWQAFMHNYLRK